MKVKAIFAASSGGHLEQILKLKPLMEKYDSVLVTEKTLYGVPDIGIPVSLLCQVNRKELKFIPLMIVNTYRSLKLLIREKPDVVICTGALVMVPVCLLAKKVFHKKLIFIESFAKISSPTLTGKLLYKYADKFMVQWESMLEVYPNAEYVGGIY